MALYFKNEKIAGFGGMPVIMEGIDTTDATAKASDILLGKTAYVNDVKITGTSTFDADTKDATATVADILSGKTAYVNGQKLVGMAQDNKAPYAWEVRKLKYDNEVVFRETITGGSSTFTNNQYLWNTGDFMVFGSNAVANGIYVFESAPDPSQSCSVEINGVNYTLSYDTQKNLTITASITDSFEFFISKSIGAGDLIKYIVDDNESTYPEDNIYPERDYYSGKWYRKVYSSGVFCWGKYGYENETIQTLPYEEGGFVVSMWTGYGQKDVSDYCWQKGDTVVITINEQTTYTIENAPEPTENLEFGDNGDSLIHIVSGDNIKLRLNSLSSGTFELEINVIRSSKILIGYVVSDKETFYPDGAIHTDGYWYERVEGFNAEGAFCWAKKDPNNLTAESIGYAEASSYLTILENSDTYTITTTSAGGWGYNYINTDLIDTTEKPIRVTYRAALSGQNMFLGFADTQGKTYSIMNESLYLTSAGAVNHQRKGSQVAGYGSWTGGDLFVMEIYQGYFTVTKNGTQLFKTATALTNACFVADFYAANKTYGNFTFETDVPLTVSYVTDNEGNAYPNDGIASDGYYYMLVGATK